MSPKFSTSTVPPTSSPAKFDSSPTSPSTSSGWFFPTTAFSSTTVRTSLSPQARYSSPSHSVVNTPAGMMTLLDTLLEALSFVPKLYSKADTGPRCNTPYSRADTQCSGHSESVNVPPLLFNMPRSPPALYLGAEGHSLSRCGELSILMLHVETERLSHTYLIQVHVLKYRAFSTKDSKGRHSLRSILQDSRTPKVFFDVRMDSDALFGQYKVFLAGIIDLQLMKVASRGGEGGRLPSLRMCLEHDADMGDEEKGRIQRAKTEGKKLWNPDVGGSFDRFNDSPLRQEIVDYCVADTAYMPRLFEKYNGMLGNAVYLMAVGDGFFAGTPAETRQSRAAKLHAYWACRLLKESMARVAEATDPGFTGGTSLNPWVWWHPCEGEWYVSMSL